MAFVKNKDKRPYDKRYDEMIKLFPPKKNYLDEYIILESTVIGFGAYGNVYKAK